MPSVEQNIDRLDRKAAQLSIKVERIATRIERRIRRQLDQAVGRREVRTVLRIGAELERELRAVGLNELTSSISRLYGEIMGEVRDVFKSKSIAFNLVETDLSYIEAQTAADFDLVASRLNSYVARIRSQVLQTTFAGGDPTQLDAIFDSNRDKLTTSLETDVINTSQAFRNAVTFKKAEDEGIESFLYDGPRDERNRPFCKSHVGKTYTLAEIEEMQNDQGGPALTDLGGYNCRHEWRPIK